MSSGAPPTTVDVAIVNWNTSRSALMAARAFAASDSVAATVTIADNGSDPEERATLERADLTGIGLELLPENLGYGAAANRALAGGGGELVCVSNADLRPEPGALAALAAAAARPGVGMVGPAFVDESARYHAELPSRAALLGQVFAGSFRRQGVASPGEGELREVGQPSGACFAMRRDVWEEVEGFDEGFFLWYEDVDLAKRLVERGYRNLVTGSARVEHQAARSFAQLDGRSLQQIRARSLRRYIDKHHPRLAPLAAPLFRLSAALR